MGQIANQMLIELYYKIKENIKEKRAEKQNPQQSSKDKRLHEKK